MSKHKHKHKHKHKKRRETEPDEFEKELKLLKLVLKRVPEEERLLAARTVCIEAATEVARNPAEMLGILEAAKLIVWEIGQEIEAEMEAAEDEDEGD